MDWKALVRSPWHALRKRPLLSAAFVVVITALAFPLYSTTFLPFQDYPQHLALASVIRHWHSPVWGFVDHFVVEWLELSSYWVQYGSLALLALVLPMEVAGKIQILLIFALTILAAMELCRAFDRSPWIAFLIAPVFYNTNLHYGFIGFCLAVPFWLWSLAATERLLSASTRRRAIMAAAAYALTFFTHQQVFILLGGTVGVLVLLHEGPKTWQERAWRLAPLAGVTLLLFVPWLARTLLFPPEASEVVVASGVDQSYGRIGDLGLKWRDSKEILYNFFRALLSTVRSHSDRPAWLAWGLLVAAAVLGRRTEQTVRGLRHALHAFRLEAMLGVTVLAFLLMPSSMKGVYYISPRFLVLVLILYALLPRFRSERVAAVFGLAAVGLTIWVSSVLSTQYRRFDTEVGSLGAALATLPMGSRVLSLSYGAKSPVAHLAPYVHIGAYAMVRRGGIVSNTFAKTAGVPVRYRDPAATPVYKRNSNPFDAKNRAFFDHVLLLHGPERKGGRKVGLPGYVREAKRTFVTLYDDGTWTVLRYPPAAEPWPPSPASAPGP